MTKSGADGDGNSDLKHEGFYLSSSLNRLHNNKRLNDSFILIDDMKMKESFF